MDLAVDLEEEEEAAALLTLMFVSTIVKKATGQKTVPRKTRLTNSVVWPRRGMSKHLP